ncbi:hypothetical protein HDU99_001353, partial [Rhizoclosmatium hyalinum]
PPAYVAAEQIEEEGNDAHLREGSSDGAGYAVLQDDVEAQRQKKPPRNTVPSTRKYRYFNYKRQRYVFQEGANTFVRINASLHVLFDQIHPLRHGLTSQKAAQLLTRTGENQMQISQTPFLTLLANKLIHPFYLFQVASIIIWLYEDYILYSFVIAVTSTVSILWEIHTTRKNQRALQKLVHLDDTVTVLRDGSPKTIASRHLVVGDAIIMTQGKSPADVVLVQGDVVVDESGLTGETVNVVKTALSKFECRGNVFAADQCRVSMVYAGTEVVELKPGLYVGDSGEGGEKVVGIVVATGFNCSKGSLVRGILYPKKVDIRFYKDAMVFMGILGLIALVAFANRVTHGLKKGFGTVWVLFTSLDLITIAVPPALPLVLTIGVSQAVRRLKKKNIFCISPDRVNYAGRVDVFCWDKTGTLTLPSVSWAGVEKTRDGIFTGFRPIFRKDGDGDMERAVAACHCLNQVNGELIGSAVDKELFEATKYRLSQDEPTMTWNGNVFPVIAKVFRPQTLAPTPVNSPGIPEETTQEASIQ